MDASRIDVPPERRREEQPGSVSGHNVGIPHETVTAPDDLSPGAVVRVADAALPTQFGEFRIAVYQVEGVPDEIVALVRGDPSRDESPLVRLHSECLTGDVLGSLRCDCGEQLEASLQEIARSSAGVLLYLRQEGRGIGLVDKIRAYALQDEGLDTVDANLALGLPVDSRDYGAAAEVLRSLGITAVRILTNNPEKSDALRRHGIRVTEQVPLVVEPNPANVAYLRTKAHRLGHQLSVQTNDEQAEPELE